MSDPNPLLEPWTDPHEAPPFGRFEADHFLPAIHAGIAAHGQEIAAITADPAAPDFVNTMVALERAGAMLARVKRLFWMLASAQSDAAIRAIEPEISALLTRHGTAISHDPALFARVAAVHATRATLDPEQRRLVENSYRGFVRNGAGLAPAAKERFAAIDARLAQLSVAFGQNVLAATQAWTLVLAAEDLAGLPDTLRAAAARRAEAQGQAGSYLFTLDRGDVEAFLTYADRRDLRERVWRGFTGRCDGGPHDNRAIIAETVALRHESAALLGFATYADYVLDDSMARTPDAAEALLMRVWHPARAQALAEGEALQAMIDAEGGPALAAWDWRYYSERVRRERYAVDAAAIRERLHLAGVRDAAFAAAGRLYGLRFDPLPDAPVYHPDVQAWAIRDGGGGEVGLLYTDYFTRPEKHGGAWMGSLRIQETMDGVVRPIVYTVANFARGAVPEETRLALNEAQTLFHEFGHALHALLSNVTYPSLAGTAVARDFVEFPSKFMEHWIVAPEVLRGFGVPDEVIAAIGRADGFGQGFATVEFVASAIVDLALHRTADGIVDADAFEAATLAAIGMPAAIAMRHRLPAFTHVFDGGYGSAYYSYLWSEVLDEDAFAAFRERGDIFDAELAGRFRREVLGRGDARDPLLSFAAFRGRLPDETPLLKARGLMLEEAA